MSSTSRTSVLLQSVRLLVAYLFWRTTGFKPLGRTLIHALEAREPVRQFAGILLVRARHHSIPLLREALRARFQLPIVLTILADIGIPSLETEITVFLEDVDPGVAHAAREAIKSLNALTH